MTPSLTNAGKPDEITQDAWDAGMKEARFYADWLHAGNSSGSVSPHAVTALADTIARSIMAAKASAFSEVAEMMDAFADTADFSAMNARDDDEVAFYRIEEGAHRGAAAAIRKRGGE